jgi:hypothetical protein
MRMVENGRSSEGRARQRPDGIPWLRRGGDVSREDIWWLDDEGGDDHLADGDDPDDDPDDDEDEDEEEDEEEE